MNNTLIILDKAFSKYKKRLPTDINKRGTGTEFDFFVASLIHKDQNPNFDDLLVGITDGQDDQYIDAAHVMVNGTYISETDDLPDISEAKIVLTLIQAKHEDKLDLSQLDLLSSTVAELIKLESNDVRNNVNARLADMLFIWRTAVEKYDKINLSIRVVYACRGPRQSQNALAKAEEKKNKIIKNIKNEFPRADVLVEVMVAHQLDALESRSSIQHRDLKLKQDYSIETQPGPSYVVLLGLSDFIEFCSTTEGVLADELFEFNVRDFEGDRTAVNTAIRQTVENASENTDFWWLNNGITMLTSHIDMKTKKHFILTDPKIVNGLQTAHVLHSAKNALKENDRRVLLVKIVQTDDSDIEAQVIAATNSQTKLRPYAIKVATSQFHKLLERYLAGKQIFYERRKNFYSRRKKKIDQIVKPLRLAQIMVSLRLFKPHIARARPSTVFQDGDLYKQVFADESEDFDQYAKAIRLEQALNRFWREIRKREGSHIANNLRFHTLMVLVWILLGEKSNKFFDINSQSISDEKIDIAFQLVKKVFENGEQSNKYAGQESFTKKVIEEFECSLKNKGKAAPKA